VWRAHIGGQDEKSVFALDVKGRDHDRQFPLVMDLVGKRLSHEPEWLDVREVRPTDPRPPKYNMRDHGGELFPFADRDPGRDCRDRSLNGRKKAAHMDVELVLGSNDGGVDDECDRVAIWRAPSGVGEKGSRAPCGVEIVRRRGRP
jgi:hypothetical protein